jgi:hypothetical protein
LSDDEAELRGGGFTAMAISGEPEAYFLLTKAGRMRVGNRTDSQCKSGASALQDRLPSN